MSNVSGPRIVSTIHDVRQWRRKMLLEGKKVAFVPTMGALHEGHLSLVETASQNAEAIAVSIFVNPAQFAPHEDLSKYPRTLPTDVELLSRTPCNVVFVPQVAEMYPSGITLDVSSQVGTFVSVQGKSHQMEGTVRPHFFRGVATVVTKLFNIVQPDIAVFGQKDAQQCAIVRTLIRDLCMPIQLVVAPTRREADGLAMSSRNRYLSKEDRMVAPVLYKGLARAEKAFKNGENRRSVLVGLVEEEIRKENKAKEEYVSLATPYMLEEIDVVGKDGAILSGAVKVGNTRLIDNVLLGCWL
ncbi:Pantoate-beta-alanine ligase [Paraphysoderma sedebokerense]|nr:Pantoate-beta-alanine ligase [Paraphysoderma sedebokerense]